LKFENYNVQSKNLVHKGVEFYVENALKLTYEHRLIPKKIQGVIPRSPIKGEKEEGAWLLGMNAPAETTNKRNLNK